MAVTTVMAVTAADGPGRSSDSFTFSLAPDIVIHGNLYSRTRILPVGLFPAQNLVEYFVVGMELKFVAGALVQQSPYQTVVHPNRKRMGIQNDDLLQNLWKISLRRFRETHAETHGPQIGRVRQAKPRQVKHSNNATMGVGAGVNYACKVCNQEHSMLYDVIICDAMPPERLE